MPSPITVGKIKVKNQKHGVYWSYRDVKYDECGWACVDDFLPMEFELCYLKTDDNKSLMGWYTGAIWDGMKVKETDVIKYWKRIYEKE